MAPHSRGTNEKSLEELLNSDPLAIADQELRRRESSERFAGFLASKPHPKWLSALHTFAQTPPWSYWDSTSVAEALNVLEQNPIRTAAALSQWGPQVTLGLDNLFRPSPTAKFEESLEIGHPLELLRLANEFHPDYLRLAEHIFGNLMRPYWAVLRRGGVGAKFDLGSAVNTLNDRRTVALTAGFDDRICNAVAHGEVAFRGTGIEYGTGHGAREISTYDFLRTYDQLTRTCNALALGLLLYCARHWPNDGNDDKGLPLAISVLLASSVVARRGLSVIGAIESNLPNLGRQLHIAFETNFKSREVALLDASRLAFHLLRNGAGSYSRYLFEVVQKPPVVSLVIVSPSALHRLVMEEASAERVSEIFVDTPLLWYGEPRLRARIRAWRAIFLSQIQLQLQLIQDEWERRGIKKRAPEYTIKEVANASDGNRVRVNATVVLRNSDDADNREHIHEVAKSAAKALSTLRMERNPGQMPGGRGGSGLPAYVWMRIYRTDGTARWLKGPGWAGGNLLAVVEKVIQRRRPPIFVRQPEETWGGMRFRYSIGP